MWNRSVCGGLKGSEKGLKGFERVWKGSERGLCGTEGYSFYGNEVFFLIAQVCAVLLAINCELLLYIIFLNGDMLRT